MSTTQDSPQNPPQAPSTMAEKFVLQEYDALREELMECVKETRSLERNALLASGAVWAWAIANRMQNVYEPLLLVPPLIALLSALRAWALAKHLKQIAAYIATVENRLHLPPSLGWERTFSRSTDKSKSRSAVIFWLTLVGATVAAAVWYK